MDKAWKILEIDLIIEKIKNNLKTKKGLEILNLLKPSNDFSYITNELNKFNELDKYEEMFGVLPISTNIDLDELINHKLDKTIAKYPVDKTYGSSKKYNEL